MSFGYSTGINKSGRQERASLFVFNSLVFLVAHSATAVNKPLLESPATDLNCFLSK